MLQWSRLINSQIVETVKIASYLTPNLDREKRRALAKQYALIHSEQLKRKGKRYRNQVKKGIVIPRERVNFGSYYMFLPR